MVTMSARCRRSPQKVGFYDIQKTIGRGNFAEVKLARHRITKTEVAIKIIDKTSLDQTNLKKIYREIQILKLLNHQHIIKLYQVIQTNTTIYLVCEYARNGELFDYISQKGKLPEDRAQKMFWQVLCAVEYCHKNNVVHRDLKAENMLLDGNNNIKLADFGFGNFFQSGQNLSTWCGSPPYAAPEVFEGKVYEGPQLDVWSLGVVLYVLVCGTFPFDGTNLSALKERVLGGIFRIPYWMSQECENLLRRMLVLNPKKRLTISQIKKHKWLDSVRPTVNPYSNFNEVSSNFRRGSEYNEHVFKIMQNLGLDISKTKESLNLSEYDHLYAIYHLLADRLKLHRTSYPLESNVCEKRRPSNIAEQVLLSVPKFVSNPQNRSSNPLMVAFNKTTLSENVKSITNTMEVDDVCFDDVATGLPIINRTLVDSPPLPLIKTTPCHDEVENHSFNHNTNFNLLHIPNTGVPMMQQKLTYGYNFSNPVNVPAGDEMTDTGYSSTRSILQQRRHTLMVPDANHIAQFNLGLLSQINATNISSRENMNHALPELTNNSGSDQLFDANQMQMFNMQYHNQNQIHVAEQEVPHDHQEMRHNRPRNLNSSPIGFREGRRASDGLLLLGDSLLKERLQKLARVKGVPELTKDIDSTQQTTISNNPSTLIHSNIHGSNGETLNFQPYNNSQSLSRRRSLQVQHTQMRRSSVTAAPMQAHYSNEKPGQSSTYTCQEKFSGSHPHVSDSMGTPEEEYLRHWSSWKQVQQGFENQNESNFGSNEDATSIFSSIGMSVASDDSVPSKAAVAAQIQRDALQKPIRQQSLPISSNAKGNYPFSSAFSNHPQSLVQQLQQRRFERKIKVASHQQALAYQSPLPELEHLRICGEKSLNIPPHSLSTGGLLNVAHTGDLDQSDHAFSQENSVHGIRCFDEQTNINFGRMNAPITLNEYIVDNNLEFKTKDLNSPEKQAFLNFGNNNSVLSWVQDNPSIPTKNLDPMNIAMF